MQNPLKDGDLKSNHRRVFLKKFIGYLFVFLSVLFVCLSFLYLKPKKPKKREYKYFAIADDKIPKEGVKKIDIQIENSDKTLKIYLVKTADSIIALSPVCTHLGCFVNFDRISNEFICPCHGGRYDILGNVLGGPPKKPLERLPLKIENAVLFVGLKL